MKILVLEDEDGKFDEIAAHIKVVVPDASIQRERNWLAYSMAVSNAKFDLIRVSTLNGDPVCDHNYFLDRIESARHCEAFLGRSSRCNCFLDTFLEMGPQCTHDSLMPPVCSHLSRCLDSNIQFAG